MKAPLVSIVVCTRNRAAYLGATLETIFAQEYRPVEVLVVDDGSTDDTAAVVRAWGEGLRYHRQEQRGIAAARTVGCRLARGEYIAFQDDDDLMPPGRIPDLLCGLRQYPDAVLATGDWALIDPEGRDTGKRSRFLARSANGEAVVLADGYRAVLWPLVTPLPHTTLFRRSDAERVGWFDDGRFFHGCSDTDFFARLGWLGPIVYVPKVVSFYRMGHAQIWGNRLLGEYSRLLLFEKHLLLGSGRDGAMEKRLRTRLLSVLRVMATLRRQNGTLPEAIPADYEARVLALLGTMQRLRYRWHVRGRLRLR